MVNRIQEILNRYNLTAAKLADRLEVPRSTISHILTGRNKPSLEFIQKVLHYYPDINTDWLVKGEGSISGQQQDLFSSLENFSIDETNKQTMESNSEQKKNPPEISFEPPSSDELEKDEKLSEEKFVGNLPKISENQTVLNQKTDKQKSRKTIRIITFYADNTFDEFYPSGYSD